LYLLIENFGAHDDGYDDPYNNIWVWYGQAFKRVHELKAVVGGQVQCPPSSKGFSQNFENCKFKIVIIF
jgi:hypothetical protein